VKRNGAEHGQIEIVFVNKRPEAMRRAKTGLYSLLMLVLLAFAASLTAQKADKDKDRGNAANSRG
jgi:hypothetical protein